MTDPTSSRPELLAIVEVEQDARVRCQAPGCVRSVFKRIHVVRHDGQFAVYGSDCVDRIFAGLMRDASPRYGGAQGRRLTEDERQLLLDNTEGLLLQFEAVVAEGARRTVLEEPTTRDRRQPVHGHGTQPARLNGDCAPPTDAELASVLNEAKRSLRARFEGVDPDAPGWRGLVLMEQWKLLGRS